MAPPTAARIAALALIAAALATAAPASAQDLGHKLLGTVGLDAGTVPPPGLYAALRVVGYRAERLADRDGHDVPVENFELQAVAQAFGVSGTVALPALGARLSATAGVPLAWVQVESGRPEASVDRFGLGDVYLQPLELGFELPDADALVSYAVYLPSDRFVLGDGDGDGVSRGHVTHELAAGGALYAGAGTLTALVSYEHNRPKSEIDITRGDTIQAQGGAGVALWGGALEIGAVGYALRQVRDDRGDDLPPALRGARDQAFGVGAELGLRLARVRTRVTLRYAHDLGVRSRTAGHLLLFGLSFASDAPRPLRVHSP